MKNKWFKIGMVAVAVAAVALVAFGSAAYAQGPGGDNTAPMFGRGYRMGFGRMGAQHSAAVVTPNELRTAAVSAQEIADLQYMREEEKLAHDIYAAMYAKYGLPIFNNISRSEAQHMSAVKNLLDRYGIADPAAGKAAGEFTNSDLQALYDQLLAQGNLSLNDALKVGVVIEQTDIQDLQTRLAATTQWDVQRVYTNLLRGSQNHLRAFQRFVK